MTPPDVTVPAGSTRDLRPLTPLWRISGRFTLRTPLHIGTGRDESITLPDRPSRDTLDGAPEQADRHVAAVARDHQGRPCIPASSFKGALAELARRVGLAQELQARLFGAEDRDQATTRAGQVEFVTLYLDPAKLPSKSELPDFATADHPHVAQLPHVSRNRHTGAAEHQRLYLQSVLPPGAEFAFECTARGLSEPEVAQLLGLLALAGDDASPLRLGAGQAADQGRIAWSDPKAQRIDSAAALWAVLTGAAPSQSAATPASTPPKPRPGQRVDLRAQVRAQPAAQPASHPAAAVPTAASLQPRNLWNHPGLAPVDRQLRAATLPVSGGAWLCLADLQLKFHSPFLVYQANTRKKVGSGEPDGVPRRDHQGRGLLPAHSLHGALRAQAERILRTVGRSAAAGYEVPGVNGLADLVDRLGRDELDLATLLFGAPGWRSLLRCSDFVDEQGCATQIHHQLAIDRLTGGGKDSAKFAIKVLDCPTLTGRLELDLHRLARVEAQCPGTTARALGLLAHVLRDLDDGDIPLGYGASKGYGQSTSRCADRLAEALQRYPADGPQAPRLPTLADALAAWATSLPSAEPSLPCAPPVPGDLLQPLAPPPANAAQAEPDRFHNPYVFIPFPTPRPDDPHLPWADGGDLGEGRAAHHSHARYASDALHGELRCRLTTTAPVFVGAGDAAPNEQTAGRPMLKQPYRLGGQLAIPATSLRGLLSGLHESLTASRLRAATDRRDSVRWVTDMQQMDPTAGSPSAIGRLIQLEGRNGFWLQMLALPVLAVPNPGQTIRIPKAYSALLEDRQALPLKSLIGDASTSFDKFLNKVCFLENRLDLQLVRDRNTGQFSFDCPKDSEDELHTRRSFLLGHRRRDGELPTNRPVTRSSQRGLLRVMRHDERDLPDRNSRYHEVFVPFTPQQESVRAEVVSFLAQASAAGRIVSDAELIERYKLLPVPDEVMTCFCQIADAMTATQDNEPELEPEEVRPYHPLGRKRNPGTPEVIYGGLERRHASRALRPQHNDLVYFRPANDGRSIAEISYSNLWRRSLNTSTAEFLAQVPGARPETSLMADPKHPPKGLSPSELLFGTVEVRSPRNGQSGLSTDTDPADPQDPILAWMGKLRPSAALPLTNGDQRCEGEVTLKILSSPKPPSPSMYFQPRPGRRAESTPTKADLWFKPGDYQLRGRKAYLHALRDADQRVRPLDSLGRPDPAGKVPWESHDPNNAQTVKQKVRVTPLAAGNRFEFSLRFANLSQAELESLCAALRPTEQFEHKIGMGKPIGLGSVKIEFTGLKLSDRAARYRQTDFSAPAALLPLTDPVALAQTLSQRHMTRLQKTEPAVVRALQLIGDAAQVKYPVHYPQKAGKGIETENYEWFVDNDKVTQQLRRETRQSLETLDARSTDLRGLSRRPRGG